MNTHKIPSGHKLSSCILVCFMAFAFLSNVLFTSCKESSKQSYTIDSLYGLWDYRDSTGIFILLELRQDNKALYYCYAPGDSAGEHYNNHLVFHTFTLSGDSLIMTDVDNSSTTLVILEYTDSTMMLPNLIDRKEKICLSRSIYGKYERNDNWFKPEDSLDYVMNEAASYELLKKRYDDCVKGYKLSKGDLAQVLDMMRMCADRDSVSQECNVARLFPLNWYIRQYAAYINKEGHIMVYVSLTYNDVMEFGCGDDGDYHLDDFLNEINVCDGGEYYARARIDLTSKKVLYFKVHGVA